MIPVRVGGVPEHFNLAWHLAIEKGTFAANNINLRWVDVPGGTGAMCRQLRNGELDIAIALTEGIIADILNGNPVKIAQFYVNSPLRWGIFVNAKSTIHSVAQMPGNRYAISRPGSGSHLMALVNARNNHFTISDSDFVVVKDLEGARQALAEGRAELFMWEKYTTKPYVESGEFKLIGECITPWPCFVIAVSDKFIEQHEAVLNCILNIVNHSCQLLKNNSLAPSLIVKRYGINHNDASEWFRELEYACQNEMGETELRLILWRLHQFNIIRYVPQLSEVIHTPNLEPVDGYMLE